MSALQLQKIEHRRFLRLSAILIALAAIFALSGYWLARAEDHTEIPDANIVTWTTQKVTNTKLFSWMGTRSLRRDSSGVYHVAYGGDSLYYAFSTDGGVNWTLQTVDDSSGVGLYASLDLDSANKPHISYYDANTGSLKYARNTSGTWEKFVIDTPAMASSFEISNDAPLTTDGLPERTAVLHDWNNVVTNGLEELNLTDAVLAVTAMQGRGLFTSIDIDNLNQPHIAYYDSIAKDLKYAHTVYNGWRIDAIDTQGDVGQYNSMAVVSNSQGKIMAHFSYYSVDDGDLRYARWDKEANSVATKVSVDTSGTTGLYTSIAMTHGSAPQPRISYYDASNGNLRYATASNENGTAWNSILVDGKDADRGMFTSLALDSSNDPRISYYDATNLRLRMATYSSGGGNWGSELVHDTSFVGKYTSIVLDSSNLARISYFASGSGQLYFASQPAPSTPWTLKVVDSTANMGPFNALAYDNTGKPHVAFMNDTSDDLYYAKWNGAGWDTSLVDGAGETGLYADIALDSNNVPHIAYYNLTTTCLRYATWVTDHWVAENVEPNDTNGNCAKVGKYASIDVDNFNRPHISYYDEKNGDLKWAYKDSGIWNRSVADPGVPGGASLYDVGAYTSIAIDSLNNPHISYYDVSRSFLRYAYYQGTQWHISDKLDTPNKGMYTSLALDAQDYPHIAYMDDQNEDTLKYCWKDASGWHYEIVDPVTHIYGKPDIPLVPIALAVDGSGTPHISYYDFQKSDLRYARRISGNWQFYIVAGTGDDGQFSSIAIGPGGAPGITYYDATNGDLRFAQGAIFTLPYDVFLPVIMR